MLLVAEHIIYISEKYQKGSYKFVSKVADVKFSSNQFMYFFINKYTKTNTINVFMKKLLLGLKTGCIFIYI